MHFGGGAVLQTLARALFFPLGMRRPNKDICINNALLLPLWLKQWNYADIFPYLKDIFVRLLDCCER